MLRLKATQDTVGNMGIHASPKGYAGRGGSYVLGGAKRGKKEKNVQ